MPERPPSLRAAALQRGRGTTRPTQGLPRHPTTTSTLSALPGVPPGLLGESPFWHPTQQVLYWCDIAGQALNRFDPATGKRQRWAFDSDVACCAPLRDGTLALALRRGFVRFDPATGRSTDLPYPLPYDPLVERFNDGKADARGRYWVGTLYEPRDQPRAGLHCLADGSLTTKASGVTVGNGLAWSPDNRTLLWADTKAHVIHAFDFDLDGGNLSRRRVHAQFPPREEGQALGEYGGRPDGAAMDADGCCWVAMFEGARLVRLNPEGHVIAQMRLPVRCPTMPCFGGADLRTLYITTSRERRPADELALEPLAGCVLHTRVDVPGLPVHFVDL